MGTRDVSALIPSQSPIPVSPFNQVAVQASAMFRPESQLVSAASTSNAHQQPRVVWPKRVFTAPRRDVVLEAGNRGGIADGRNSRNAHQKDHHSGNNRSEIYADLQQRRSRVDDYYDGDSFWEYRRGLRGDQSPRSRSGSVDSIHEILRERKWENALKRGGKAEYKCLEDVLAASNAAEMKESYRASERTNEIPSLFAIDVGPPRARTVLNQLEFIPLKDTLELKAAAPSHPCASDDHRSRSFYTKDSRGAASIFAKAIAYCSTASCSNANLEAHEKRKEERNALTHLQNDECFDVDIGLNGDSVRSFPSKFPEVRGEEHLCAAFRRCDNKRRRHYRTKSKDVDVDDDICASKLASVVVIPCAEKVDSVSVWPRPLPDHVTVGSHILRFSGIHKGITASSIFCKLAEFAAPDHFNVHIADGGATVICPNRKTACRIYEQNRKLRLGDRTISMTWQPFDKKLWDLWDGRYGVCFIPNHQRDLEFDNLMNGTVDLRTWLPKNGLDNVHVDVAF